MRGSNPFTLQTRKRARGAIMVFPHKPDICGCGEVFYLTQNSALLRSVSEYNTDAKNTIRKSSKKLKKRDKDSRSTLQCLMKILPSSPLTRAFTFQFLYRLVSRSGVM